MTKQMKRWYREFEQVKGRTLFECYEKPSNIKKAVWQQLKNDDTVKDLTVISYNTFSFTVAYIQAGIFTVDTGKEIHQVKLELLND